MKKLNLDDVAKLAFVSRSVVSRVLNNNPNVSAEARRRVEEVIKEYNYSPSFLGRSLSSNRTNEICILAPRRIRSSLSSGFWPLLQAGIFEKCIERGYFTNLTFVSEDIEKDINQRILNDNRFDGFILITQEVSDLVAASLNKREASIVLIGHNDMYPDIPSVDVDNYYGAYLATRHFCNLGIKKIGAILGNLQWKESYDKKNAFITAMSESALEINEGWIVETSYSEESGYATMKYFLDKESYPSAFICGSDSIAMGVLSCLKDENLNVPADIAIIGFDDLPFSNYTVPKLTTVHQPIYEKGQYAADTLINIIEDKSIDNEHKVLLPQLIIRESCGATLKTSAI